MPQVFKIGPYIVYFWSDEGKPLEPVHVHIAEGTPQKNATKLWITGAGKALLVNNNSHIPQKDLRNLIRMVEANAGTICKKWIQYFETISYYC